MIQNAPPAPTAVAQHAVSVCRGTTNTTQTTWPASVHTTALFTPKPKKVFLCDILLIRIDHFMIIIVNPLFLTECGDGYKLENGTCTP